MDKRLKMDPGFADKLVIYQKESIEKELKISDFDIKKDTIQEYILANLFEKELENEEIISTGNLSLHLFHLIVFTKVEAELDHHPTINRQKGLDTIYDSLKEDNVNDSLSLKEIVDAISKQYIAFEKKHIQEYVKKKIIQLNLLNEIKLH